MNFSSFRKLDYLIFYIIVVVLFTIQLANILFSPVIGILIGATIPALILGTITNLIFKKR
ncbi:hypothetical protein [Romboutsia sp.]|uniref:hypothetical protein n=1 Tax=Romboutsia sp. TaxID=1965302 RepID=UPI002C4A2D01|nr:hypothetical protein [Romboutsia sp.]HSQ88886.1 hypothetical protein [Romboutsia sp.]